MALDPRSADRPGEGEGPHIPVTFRHVDTQFIGGVKMPFGVTVRRTDEERTANWDRGADCDAMYTDGFSAMAAGSGPHRQLHFSLGTGFSSCAEADQHCLEFSRELLGQEVYPGMDAFGSSRVFSGGADQRARQSRADAQRQQPH
ncbi:hypothetical protein MLIT_41590 [Mycolicibacterium litorale]|uniref:Uncharacterized protein n=1 Tax=Mycolicibacterium litorale TaxID=758802 RepID=A0AAD1MWJ6_9MYCO|nr:hypothetical protein MLIT_41590 [Mycolicibacterium litorale]